MKKYRRIIAMMFTFTLLGSILAGCGQTNEATEKTETTQNRDTMYQAETLQSLMLGNYYGFATVEDIKKNGDIGLGTFDKLDGEMIVLDGVVYQAKGDGSITECEDSETSPFCSVTWFDADQTYSISDVTNLDSFKEKMNTCIQDNRNIMYTLKMHATFDSVTVRSEKSQTEPYKELAEVLKTDQVLFPELKNVTGTVVAVYFPDYMDGINTPGWHFHFVSDDHKSGGHIMDITFQNADAQVDATTGFHMVLPDDKNFAGLKLTTEMDEAIAKVEGGKK